jgi:DNA-binding transcriptional ArsR family regulator
MRRCFDYDESMVVIDDGESDAFDAHVASMAAAIGEPRRARMLCSLLDHRAKTATELAAIAGISASTASTHLRSLLELKLLSVQSQGRHRYFRLAGPAVAKALESLGVLAHDASPLRLARTPPRLRFARSCYDHLAGALGVTIHDRFLARRWLTRDGSDYAITEEGRRELGRVGIDVVAVESARRRVAYGCLDWSERRPHLAGALGAAVLDLLVKRKWVRQEIGGRALSLTTSGQRQLPRELELALS